MLDQQVVVSGDMGMTNPPPPQLYQVLRWRKQVVTPNRDYREGRFIWGNPRNYPKSGKSNKLLKQDLFILFSLLRLFSRKKLDSEQETTEGFKILHSPLRQLWSFTSDKTFYRCRCILYFSSEACKPCASPSATLYTHRQKEFFWDRRGKARHNPNQAKSFGRHLFPIREEMEQALLARKIQVPRYCFRVSTSVQSSRRESRRVQGVDSKDLEDTGYMFSSVMGCLSLLSEAPGLHLFPAASPCNCWCQTGTHKCLFQCNRAFYSSAWAKLEKKKLYLRHEGSVLTGRSSPCATSLCREAFRYVSPISSLKWSQLGCFSTLRRNKFKTDVNVIMGLRLDWDWDISFSLSSQAFL